MASAASDWAKIASPVTWRFSDLPAPALARKFLAPNCSFFFGFMCRGSRNGECKLGHRSGLVHIAHSSRNFGSATRVLPLFLPDVRLIRTDLDGPTKGSRKTATP